MLCLHCSRIVFDHPQTVDCDVCGAWQHRRCNTEMLLLNKKRSQGPPKTFKPPPSSVLAEVRDFLPRLAVSNQLLEEAVENGEKVDIENVEDTDGPLIQMDLALLEQDSDCEDCDSSDESIQGEITEGNLRLQPKGKNKPVIEMINNSQHDNEISDDKENNFDIG